MSRLLITFVLMLSLVLSGCAATLEEQQLYHESITETNLAKLQIVERQTELTRQGKADSMIHFSQAMVAAANTESPTDDAVIAFAWGFISGKPEAMTIPELQYPAAPVTDVDRVLAWTPMVGMVVPFLQPLLYGGYGNSGTEIVATDQATIMLDSGNAGSYNKVSGGEVAYDAHGNPVYPETTGPAVGNSTVTNKHDDLVIYNTDGGDLSGIQGGGAIIQPIEPDEPGEPGISLCADLPDGGYMNPVTGKWYTDANQTCSCGSRAAGEC